MSEASLSHCVKCGCVVYDCDCEEPDLQPSLVNQIWSGAYIDTIALMAAGAGAASRGWSRRRGPAPGR
jgi:hypothetical protein